MSPAVNGSTVLQCFKRGSAVEIHNIIMFDFYPGLPHMELARIVVHVIVRLITNQYHQVG